MESFGTVNHSRLSSVRRRPVFTKITLNPYRHDSAATPRLKVICAAVRQLRQTQRGARRDILYTGSFYTRLRRDTARPRTTLLGTPPRKVKILTTRQKKKKKKYHVWKLEVFKYKVYFVLCAACAAGQMNGAPKLFRHACTLGLGGWSIWCKALSCSALSWP